MITVHVGAKSTRQGSNFAWMWSTKSKKGTWGKSEGTETVAEIFAIISALNKLAAYSTHNIVFVTTKNEIYNIVEKKTKSNHMAIVELRKAMYLWKGKINIKVITPSSQDETHRYVVTTLNKLIEKKLSKEPVAKKDMNTRIIEMGTKQRNNAVLKKPTSKPRKLAREVLITSFNDDDDAPRGIPKSNNVAPPTMQICPSCNGKINIYTNECRCSV